MQEGHALEIVLDALLATLAERGVLTERAMIDLFERAGTRAESAPGAQALIARLERSTDRLIAAARRREYPRENPVDTPG